MKILTGKKLNKLWGVGARHALYREDGKWYHNLVEFPGALFDANGYIVFNARQDYENCEYLQLQQDLNIPSGISGIPGYVRVTEANQLQAFSHKLKETSQESNAYSVMSLANDAGQPSATSKASDMPEGQEETKRALSQTYRIIRDTELAKRVKQLHDYQCQICGQALELGDGGLYAEAHHIKPLGGRHSGPDVIENIICVCPNHHALLDYGAIPLEKVSLRLVEGHSIGDVYLQYHNTAIYIGNMG